MSVIEKEAPVVEAPTKVDMPSQLLEAAAEYIERYGWFGHSGHVVQGHSPNKDHPVACAAVALLRVNEDDGLGDDEDFNQAWYRLERLVRGNGLRSIFDWNDAPERTPQEVCRTLREAAAKPS